LFQEEEAEEGGEEMGKGKDKLLPFFPDLGDGQGGGGGGGLAQRRLIGASDDESSDDDGSSFFLRRRRGDGE